MTESNDIKILTDNQHVLKRPGMYIGPITTESKEFWIPNKGKMVKQEIEYIPGLYKIFCEVLDNAIDEHQRGFCNEISVEVDYENNRYAISDNGRGISPAKHSSGKYTPEVVFTVLRSGSNFDDNDRSTIGMNGVGASLTNIFSSKFYIEILRDNKCYTQTFKDNNTVIEEPIIKSRKTTKTGTKVVFYPDTNIFKKRLNPVLIYKRCLELAYMFPTLTIKLDIDNKVKEIDGRKFETLIEMFGTEYDIVEDKKLGIRLAVLKSDGNGFGQFSNVNGADTWRGGSHVDYVRDIFTGKLKEIMKKEHKLEVTNADVQKHIMVVLFQKMNAPNFDGQTKEKLSTDKKIISDIFDSIISPRKLTTMTKSLGGIVQQIFDAVSQKNDAKEIAELRKAQRDLKSKKIAKLIDCNNKDRSKCTLYITEGDSAVGGISSVRDPKTQAGLPLRGKILNVTGMSPKQIIENEEIKTLMSAIGLEFGSSPIKVSRGKYELGTLRYGNISILTDADYDGSAIRCLLVNFFYRFWPELFYNNIITISEAPIYEVYESKGKNTHFFYEREEYENFMKGKNSAGLVVSYFKGLGSCDKNAWDYFINSNPRMYPITLDDNCKEKLSMAFGDSTDKRKEWLR